MRLSSLHPPEARAKPRPQPEHLSSMQVPWGVPQSPPPQPSLQSSCRLVCLIPLVGGGVSLPVTVSPSVSTCAGISLGRGLWSVTGPQTGSARGKEKAQRASWRHHWWSTQTGLGPRAGGEWAPCRVLVHMEGAISHPPPLALAEILCSALVPLCLVVKILSWRISGIQRSRGNYLLQRVSYTQWADFSSCEANPRCSIFPGPRSRALGVQMCVCGSFVNCRAFPGEPRGLPAPGGLESGKENPCADPGQVRCSHGITDGRWGTVSAVEIHVLLKIHRGQNHCPLDTAQKAPLHWKINW